ncbi:uncharacterized protein IUM83_10067 [Phytophthora cinnamomi]|uniref:uncharacterized protein n=1 Tax=Phytophthora cinnamomi TaxID=4785 RepID=UPI00355A7774|nr:hypothetical protein IUM83_10067 [Phytophthora cinnamomi]
MDPIAAWGYFTSTEFGLISRLRQHRLAARVRELVESLVSSDTEAMTSESEDEAFDSASLSDLADATGRMSVASGDEF